MNRLFKPDFAIPAGVFKRAAQVPQPFALFIFLDSIPYCEVAERDAAAFKLSLAQWKRNGNLDALKKSAVRFFLRGKDLAIYEVAP